MAHRSSFRRPTARSRRKSVWSVGPQSSSSLTSTAKTLWTNGTQLVSEAETTVVRIRGTVLVRLTLASTALDGFTGALGIGVVTAESFAAGAASCPGALTQVDWDGWMWHTFFHVFSPSSDAEVDNDTVSLAERFVIDTKAMRIQKDTDVMFGSIETLLTGGSTVQFKVDTRMLNLLT